MTDQTIPEEQKPEEQRTNWGKVGIFITTLAMIIFVCGFGYGYFQLSQVNISLAQTVADLQHRITGNQSDLEKTQSAISALQQASQKSADLSKQQEQLMAEWRAAQQGDLNKWHVAEAQYLVKLANDHLEFNHNMTLALTLLQRADQILTSSPDATVLQIRKSIAADIANLQATPQVDVTSMYVKLSGLNSQIDQLLLPTNPIKPDNTVATTDLPADAPWWKVGWQKTLNTLHKIVIVRYNDSNSLPLALPDEKVFLYQNLHAQFENTMLALLDRNEDVYQLSLLRANNWVRQYFNQDDAATKAMLQNLDELVKINIQPPTVNLATTLQLFDTYLTTTQAPSTDQANPVAKQ